MQVSRISSWQRKPAKYALPTKAWRSSSSDRIVVTGNPVRQDLEEASDKRAEALKFFGLSPDKKTILVVGGSLGARTINRSIQGDLDKLFASDVDVQVIWQTGRYYHEEALKHLKAYRGCRSGARTSSPAWTMPMRRLI